MASAFYRLYGRRMLSLSGATGLDVDVLTDTIAVVFANITAPGANLYTFSQTHDMFDDLSPATAIFGDGGPSIPYSGGEPILSPTLSVASVFDAADTVMTAVAAGIGVTAEGEALIIYKIGGAANASPLIAFIDSFSAITFNGGNVTIQWNAAGIFQLIP